MTILLSDERVRSIPLRDNGQRLTQLDARFGPARARVRSGVAERLVEASKLLPDGIRLQVVEGHRSAADQLAIIDWYSAELRAADLALGEAALATLTSRFVSPIEVAPHVAGAAIDVTLADRDGRELDLGTPIDATPEASVGRCFFDAPGLEPLLARTATCSRPRSAAHGFVNYPTEWWHWSYGDRYWALITGADAALYGSVADVAVR